MGWRAFKILHCALLEGRCNEVSGHHHRLQQVCRNAAGSQSGDVRQIGQTTEQQGKAVLPVVVVIIDLHFDVKIVPRERRSAEEWGMRGGAACDAAVHHAAPGEAGGDAVAHQARGFYRGTREGAGHAGQGHRPGAFHAGWGRGGVV